MRKLGNLENEKSVKRILFIGAEKANDNFFAKCLIEQGGHDVRSFFKIEDVPELLRIEEFDILFMDISSPGNPDVVFDICKSIKKDFRFENTYLSVVLDNYSAKSLNKAISTGANYLLFKPLEDASFLQKVTFILKESELLKSNQALFSAAYIDSLFALSVAGDRENFFRFASELMTEVIYGKIFSLIPDSAVPVISASASKLLDKEYRFMDSVSFFNGEFNMDDTRSLSRDIDDEKVLSGMRSYVHSFLDVVKMMTSNISVELEL